jgi:hypothetical protein
LWLTASCPFWAVRRISEVPSVLIMDLQASGGHGTLQQPGDHLQGNRLDDMPVEAGRAGRRDVNRRGGDRYSENSMEGRSATYQAPYGGLRSLPWFGSARSMPQPFAGSPSGNGNANKFATASRPVVVMSPQRPSTSGFVSTAAWGFGARNHSRCRAERLAEALAVLVSELLS